MLKQFKLFMFVFALGSVMVACNNEPAADAANDSADAAVNVNPSGDTGAQPDAQPAPEAAAPVGPTTAMTFEATEYDFGTIDQGETVSHTYLFTNTGSEPLIISNAKGS